MEKKKKSGIPDFLEDLRKAGDGITEFFSWTLWMKMRLEREVGKRKKGV